MHSLKKLTFITLPAFVFAVPFFATAQTGININAIKPYSDSIINLINGVLIPLLFALAFIVFIFGVFKYFFLHGAEESERTKGKAFILWGIIGFAVIISVWGLVNLFTNFFSLNSNNVPNAPTINFGGASGGTQTP